MAWFADLAGKAESLLNNLDEQTGAALRNHSVKPRKNDKSNIISYESPGWQPKSPKRQPRSLARKSNLLEPRSHSPPKKLVNLPNHNALNNSKVVDYLKDIPSRLRKSPTRKTNYSNYDLNNCPRTLVGDEILKENGEIVVNEFGLKKRSKLIQIWC